MALGGAVGAVARWGVGALLGGGQGGFPWATLAVNVVGCAALGALAGLTGPRDDARLLLGTGLLGGFTTFSAFGLETVSLLRAGAAGLAGANVLANVVLGLLAAAAGLRLAS